MRRIAFFVGSIIGSGVLILGNIVKNYGLISFFIAMLLIIVITYIFTKIESITNTLEKVFGKKITIMLSFLYWLISWVSTLVVVNEAVYYICEIFAINKLFLQCGLTIFFTIINCVSDKHSIYVEYLLTSLKIMILIFFPITILFKSNISAISLSKLPLFCTSEGIVNVFWSFLGVEMASIMHLNTKQGIISIVLIGLLYFINAFVVLINLPEVSIRAFFDLSQMMFGNSNFIAIAIIILCIGTINSWIVASSTFAYESSLQGIFPSIFKKTYNNIPVASIILSSIGLIPLFFFLKNDAISSVILNFANLSSNLFVFFTVL